MNAQNRRAARPGVERIEARELLSALTTGLISTGRPSASSLVSRAIMIQGGGAAGGGGAYPGGAGTSPLLGAGTPTPRELARETFHASFGGPFFSGPGRFSDQARIQYMKGLGSSNFFLHGDYNMAIVTPTDPTQPIVGEAVLEDKNTNSGGLIGLVLTAKRTDVDSFGRVTKLSFTSDPNVYGGVFFITTGSGTVNIHYKNNGVASATFTGRIYTNGLTNPLVNSDLYSRSGRLHSRGGR